MNRVEKIGKYEIYQDYPKQDKQSREEISEFYSKKSKAIFVGFLPRRHARINLNL